MRLLRLAAVVVLASTTALGAQAPGNPVGDGVGDAWNGVKRNVLGSAKVMPEAKYSFKPVDTVRPFGQILCDAVYASLDDKKAPEVINGPFGGGKQARATVLNGDTGHNLEHYGNLVTYLRINGLVPPSSAPSR